MCINVTCIEAIPFSLHVVERKKETVGEGSVTGSQKRKKLEKQEEQLKNYNKDLTMVGGGALIDDLVVNGYWIVVINNNYFCHCF